MHFEGLHEGLLEFQCPQQPVFLQLEHRASQVLRWNVLFI